VFGVDFSGAADAGRKIWIASGIIRGRGLRIERCVRAEALPGSARDRDLSLTALRRFIAEAGASAFGLDFPFGLPRRLVAEETWEEFIRVFSSRYPDAERFRRACLRATRGAELRRLTDRESRTPFCVYNLRLFRQTYFGIRDLLAPLVRGRRVRVLPMQHASAGIPSILEICPASTLKRAGLYAPYKGATLPHRRARGRILGALEAQGVLSIPRRAVRAALLDDRDGDALDSVVAACATARALLDGKARASLLPGAPYAIEGYVYA
jgi:hypothetical protein